MSALFSCKNNYSEVIKSGKNVLPQKDQIPTVYNTGKFSII